MNAIVRMLAVLLRYYPFLRGRSRITQVVFKFFKLNEPAFGVLPNGARIELHPTQFVSRQIFLFGVFEPREARCFQALIEPGMTVIDVGANIGQYAMLAAARMDENGHVYAFEPAEDNFQILRRNVERSGYATRVSLFKEAVAAASGKRDFVLASDGGSNALWNPGANPDNAGQTRTVKCRSLDDFVTEHRLARVDILKIDVEGADYEVLKGSRKTLEVHRPILFVEFAERLLEKFAATPKEMLDLISAFGYRAYLFSPRGLRLLESGDDISNLNLFFKTED